MKWPMLTLPSALARRVKASRPPLAMLTLSRVYCDFLSRRKVVL